MFHTAPVQSAQRVPGGLQIPAYWELHIPYTISRLFLSCRSWSTVGRWMLTPTILRQCMAGVDSAGAWFILTVGDLYATDVLNIAFVAA